MGGGGTESAEADFLVFMPPAKDEGGPVHPSVHVGNQFRVGKPEQGEKAEVHVDTVGVQSIHVRGVVVFG